MPGASPSPGSSQSSSPRLVRAPLRKFQAAALGDEVVVVNIYDCDTVEDIALLRKLIGVTELTELSPTRVDAVKQPANGVPFIMAKSVAAPARRPARKPAPRHRTASEAAAISAGIEDAVRKGEKARRRAAKQAKAQKKLARKIRKAAVNQPRHPTSGQYLPSYPSSLSSPNLSVSPPEPADECALMEAFLTGSVGEIKVEGVTP